MTLLTKIRRNLLTNLTVLLSNYCIIPTALAGDMGSDDFEIVEDPDADYCSIILHPEETLIQAKYLIDHVLQQKSRATLSHTSPFLKGIKLLVSLLQQDYAPAFGFAADLCLSIPREDRAMSKIVTQALGPTHADIRDLAALSAHLFHRANDLTCDGAELTVLKKYCIKAQKYGDIVKKSKYACASRDQMNPSTHLFNVVGDIRSAIRLSHEHVIPIVNEKLHKITELLAASHKPAYAVAANICAADDIIPSAMQVLKNNALLIYEPFAILTLPPTLENLDPADMLSLKLLIKGTELEAATAQDELSCARYKLLTLAAIVGSRKSLGKDVPPDLTNLATFEHALLEHEDQLFRKSCAELDLTDSEKAKLTAPSSLVLERWYAAQA